MINCNFNWSIAVQLKTSLCYNKSKHFSVATVLQYILAHFITIQIVKNNRICCNIKFLTLETKLLSAWDLSVPKNLHKKFLMMILIVLNYNTFRQRQKVGFSKSVRVLYKDKNHKRQRRLPPASTSGEQRKQHLEIRCRQLIPRHRRKRCYRRLQLQRPSRSNSPLRSVLLDKKKSSYEY